MEIVFSDLFKSKVKRTFYRRRDMPFSSPFFFLLSPSLIAPSLTRYLTSYVCACFRRPMFQFVSSKKLRKKGKAEKTDNVFLHGPLSSRLSPSHHDRRRRKGN